MRRVLAAGTVPTEAFEGRSRQAAMAGQPEWARLDPGAPDTCAVEQLRTRLPSIHRVLARRTVPSGLQAHELTADEVQDLSELASVVPTGFGETRLPV
jgi:hypothetical protein